MKQLVIMLVLALGLGAAYVLVGRSQLLQRGATVGTVQLSIWPMEANLTLGQTIEVTVKMSTGSEVLNGIETKLNFEKDELELVEVAPITLVNVPVGEKAFFKNNEDLVGWPSVQKVAEANSQGWLKIKAIRVEDNPASYQTGVINLVKLRLMARKDNVVAKVWVDQVTAPIAVGYVNGVATDLGVASGVVEANFAIGGVSSITGGATPNPVVGSVVKVEAERRISTVGSGQTQLTTDVGGGYNIGWIRQGSTFGYDVNVPVAGSYKLSYRISRWVVSPLPNSKINIKLGSSMAPVVDSISVPVTGGTQSWRTIEGGVVNLNQGVNRIYIVADGGFFNINWFKLTPR